MHEKCPDENVTTIMDVDNYDVHNDAYDDCYLYDDEDNGDDDGDDG